jgi:hypothetical protein
MTRIVPSAMLRIGLAVDLFGSGALGLAHVAATGAIAQKTGASPALISGSGLFMLVYAALLAWMASRQALPRRSVQIILWGNSGWILGCAMLALLLPGLSPWASTHLVLQATTVSGFVLLQAIGLTRSRPA